MTYYGGIGPGWAKHWCKMFFERGHNIEVMDRRLDLFYELMQYSDPRLVLLRVTEVYAELQRNGSAAQFYEVAAFVQHHAFRLAEAEKRRAAEARALASKLRRRTHRRHP